jgi:hypothetical protein
MYILTNYFNADDSFFRYLLRETFRDSTTSNSFHKRSHGIKLITSPNFDIQRRLTCGNWSSYYNRQHHSSFSLKLLFYFLKSFVFLNSKFQKCLLSRDFKLVVNINSLTIIRGTNFDFHVLRNYSVINFNKCK